MAAYNAERHLAAAVRSILEQSYCDFEFIIVDDASTDSTPMLLSRIAQEDSRIRLVTNPGNLGLTASLNRGLSLARGSMIARMDADDISAPHRLALQVSFLEHHPDHILVGTSYRAIDDAGNLLYTKAKGADDFAVRWWMRFRMFIEHPSSCFRARLPNGEKVFYDENFPVAQDYELFSRLMAFGKAAILSEALISYRKHPSNISTKRREEQRRALYLIARRVQLRDLPSGSTDELDQLLRCYLLEEPATPEAVRRGFAAMDQMLARDAKANPQSVRWLRRQAAGLLAEAYLGRGGGLLHPRVFLTFAFWGRSYLLPLLWRFLEDKGWLASGSVAAVSEENASRPGRTKEHR